VGRLRAHRRQRDPVHPGAQKYKLFNMNNKVYIHEFIDITKQNRARYMHHMAANWSPLAQEQRHQLCYGVWGVVGSTGRWPQVVNIWEEDGFDGLAKSFALRVRHRHAPGPGASQVVGGRGRPALRRVRPAARAAPRHAHHRGAVRGRAVTGEVFAHELITVRPGDGPPVPRLSAGRGGEGSARSYGWHPGWRLVDGDARTTSEAVLLWSIPTWESWAGAEQDLADGRDVLPPDGARRGPAPGADPARRRSPVPLPHRPPALPRRPDRLGGLTRRR
jgi:hypothetical protein